MDHEKQAREMLRRMGMRRDVNDGSIKIHELAALIARVSKPAAPLPEPKWRMQPNSEGTMRCTCDSYPHATDCGAVFGPDQMRALIAREERMREALRELVEDVECDPAKREQYYGFERFADHRPTCPTPRGDQGCQCGYAAIRANLLQLLDACEGYGGRAPIDKARAALSPAPAEVAPAAQEAPIGKRAAAIMALVDEFAIARTNATLKEPNPHALRYRDETRAEIDALAAARQEGERAGREAMRSQFLERIEKTAAHMKENATAIGKYPGHEQESRARDLASSYVGEWASLMRLEAESAIRALPASAPSESK